MDKSIVSPFLTHSVYMRWKVSYRVQLQELFQFFQTRLQLVDADVVDWCACHSVLQLRCQ